MGTHHGRPGGRLLELLSALILAVFSVAFLVFCLYGPPYVLIYLGYDGSGWALGKLGIAFVIGGMFLLKYPWTALLRYYRYEAHTLKPMTKEDDAK